MFFVILLFIFIKDFKNIIEYLTFLKFSQHIIFFITFTYSLKYFSFNTKLDRLSKYLVRFTN